MFNHLGFAWSFAYHVWCNGISCQEKRRVEPGSQTRAGAFARSPTSLCSSKGQGPLGFNNAIERREKSRRFWTVTVFAAGVREGLQDNGHKEATANTSDSYS